MGKRFEVRREGGAAVDAASLEDGVAKAIATLRLVGHASVQLLFEDGGAAVLAGDGSVELLVRPAEPQRPASPGGKPHGIPDRGRPPADGWYRHKVSFTTSKERRTRHDTPAAPFREQSYALVWRDFAGEVLLVSDVGNMVPEMMKAKATDGKGWLLAKWLEKNSPPEGAATVSYAALKRDGKPSDYAALVETMYIKAL
jgi:hypothetical protein